MSTHKHFDKICCVVLVLALLLTGLFMRGESLGIEKAAAIMGYENRLFDTSFVHTIDIVMDDWDGFLASCTTEEYVSCAVVIDGEAYKNVAIRAKGNTSLTQVQSYGNDRYSFKIEFDHYDSTKTYYGLDKLCLNNIIQDNTYMKDYLTYQLMGQFGVASPLCSYANITVNGETWGLYLAVEGVEDAFLQRNYGTNYGELYKPDSTNIGGGRGNGQGFHMDGWEELDSDTDNTESDRGVGFHSGNGQIPDIFQNRNGGEMQSPDGNGFRGGMQSPDGNGFGGGMQSPDGNGFGGGMQSPDGTGFGGNMQMPGNMGGLSMGSDDILLIYSDDEYDSYSNIFDNAKTDITDADKDRLIAALKNINENTALESSVDIEAVIRYFVVHNFVLNFDSYTGSMIHNYYLYEEDGVLSMIPWDYNLAFGGFRSADGATNLINYPIDSPVSGGSVEDRPMLAWIFANDKYTELYHQYFAEFISEYFGSGCFEEMMDSVVSMIAPYVEKDPTKFCTYEEFKTGVSTLKKFCLLRAESITGQLNGTIGSTSETQKNDTLIDAGDLQINDMGSMNNTMGGGRMERSGGNMSNANSSKFPSGKEQASPAKPDMQNDSIATNGGISEFPGGGTVPGHSGGENAFDKGAVPEMPNGIGNGMRQMGEFGQTEANHATNWMLFGISSGVLVIGLVFGILFKRRKAF